MFFGTCVNISEHASAGTQIFAVRKTVCVTFYRSSVGKPEVLFILYFHDRSRQSRIQAHESQMTRSRCRYIKVIKIVKTRIKTLYHIVIYGCTKCCYLRTVKLFPQKPKWMYHASVPITSILSLSKVSNCPAVGLTL